MKRAGEPQRHARRRPSATGQAGARADTKSLILDAAERLFAEHGFHATSLRDITSAAKVNLAAVNYHFRSKGELIRAVIGRRIGPANQERLRMLDEAERAAGKRAPALGKVIEAFARPVLAEAMERPETAALVGRLYSEPGDFQPQFFDDHMRRVAERFFPAFGNAAPHLRPTDLMWRIHLMVGGVAHTIAGGKLLETISGGRCRFDDVDEALRQLTVFFSAGLRAPADDGRRRQRGRV